MPRFSAPMFVLVVVLVLVVAGCASTQAAPVVSPSPAPPAPAVGSKRADVHLTVKGGPAEGTYDSTPTSPLALCTHTADGMWRVQFAGTGVTVDLLVGKQAGESGHASDVALEVDADDGYFKID